MMVLSNATLEMTSAKNFANTSFDDHRTPHDHVTIKQFSFFLIWLCAIVIWSARWFLGKTNKIWGQDLKHAKQSDPELVGKEQNGTHVSLDMEKSQTTLNLKEQEPTESASKLKTFSTTKTPCSFDDFLKYLCLFGALMFYFYLCDYKKVFSNGERVYSRDTFLFLVFLLFLVGCALTINPTADKILNRDQTEEWKGWMQVMFVWYHYFAAKEWYNWIRVYIAAYVWMTGFGNFSFFWVRKDFSLWRVLKMMFRLNFLVLVLCVVVDNEYMLYYICVMHSYWFLTVYAFMGVLKTWNEHRWKMLCKFLAYAICNAILFDIPGVCEKVFWPLQFIFGYHEPNHGIMHEWAFRGGLDHWACFVGMLCAYNYPHFENFLKSIESKCSSRRDLLTSYGVKLFMFGLSTAIMVWWYFSVMLRQKYAYNVVHPYTSFVPIVCFIISRNLFPILRKYYVGLFAFLGKITLETYLSQLHIYLQSNAKDLVEYIPGYPLLNFALATIIYLTISYALFHLTTEFSAFFLPKDWREICIKAGITGVVITLVVGVAFGFKQAGVI